MQSRQDYEDVMLSKGYVLANRESSLDRLVCQAEVFLNNPDLFQGLSLPLGTWILDKTLSNDTLFEPYISFVMADFNGKKAIMGLLSQDGKLSYFNNHIIIDDNHVLINRYKIHTLTDADSRDLYETTRQSPLASELDRLKLLDIISSLESLQNYSPSLKCIVFLKHNFFVVDRSFFFRHWEPQTAAKEIETFLTKYCSLLPKYPCKICKEIETSNSNYQSFSDCISNIVPHHVDEKNRVYSAFVEGVEEPIILSSKRMVHITNSNTISANDLRDLINAYNFLSLKDLKITYSLHSQQITVNDKPLENIDFKRLFGDENERILALRLFHKNPKFVEGALTSSGRWLWLNEKLTYDADVFQGLAIVQIVD